MNFFIHGRRANLLCRGFVCLTFKVGHSFADCKHAANYIITDSDEGRLLRLERP